MAKIGQTIANFTAPMYELEAAHLSGRIHHSDNPVANWMASNLVAKIDTNGNVLWFISYDGPANDLDGAVALVVDASGNVYVTGDSFGVGTGRDFATIKYTQ